MPRMWVSQLLRTKKRRPSSALSRWAATGVLMSPPCPGPVAVPLLIAIPAPARA